MTFCATSGMAPMTFRSIVGTVQPQYTKKAARRDAPINTKYPNQAVRLWPHVSGPPGGRTRCNNELHRLGVGSFRDADGNKAA
mmetsp:Transcript_20485/g.48393  ORF Transcript_20485/g.48393 Transcript_20485/m.48393 type:complete len:83 (+) Transcript_20485:684-932(+)